MSGYSYPKRTISPNTIRGAFLSIGIFISLVNGGFTTFSVVPVIGNLAAALFKSLGAMTIVLMCILLYVTAPYKGGKGVLGILMSIMTLTDPVINLFTTTLPGLDILATVPAGIFFVIIDIIALSMAYEGR